jgi:hypothetical protein
MKAYLVGVYDEGSTEVGTVAFITHSERDQENALMRHVFRTRLRSRLQIIAACRGARLDDRGVAKLRGQPVNLWSMVCDVGRDGGMLDIRR